MVDLITKLNNALKIVNCPEALKILHQLQCTTQTHISPANVIILCRTALSETLLFKEHVYLPHERRNGYQLAEILSEFLKEHLSEELDKYHNYLKQDKKYYTSTVEPLIHEEEHRKNLREVVTMYELFIRSKEPFEKQQKDKEMIKYFYLFSRYILDESYTSSYLGENRVVDLRFTINVISFLFGGYGPLLWPCDTVLQNPCLWVKKIKSCSKARIFLLDEAYYRRISQDTIPMMTSIDPNTFKDFLEKAVNIHLRSTWSTVC